MSLLSFIRSIGPNFAKLTAQERALFVIGNESADLDSCISSILSAYFYSIQPNSSLNPKFIAPVINIPRDDLQLRPDVVHLFSQIGLSSSSLLFLDDLTSKNVHTFSKSYTFLVDFNKLNHPLSTIFSQRIAGILDHHDDEGLYKKAIAEFNGPRRVLKAGSSSSIIIDYFYHLLKSDEPFKQIEVLKLALSPILIDTSNLQYRVEDVDKKSYELIRNLGNLTKQDCEELFNSLQEYKKNIKGMSPRDVLRRDYKQWEDASLTQSASQLKLGISSTVQSFEWLYKEHSDFNKEIEKWAKENDLSICCVMTTSNDREGNFQREIGIWHNEEAKETAEQLIRETSSHLQLEPKNIQSTTELLIFQQKNLAASRKQVAPLFRNIISGTSLPAL